MSPETEWLNTQTFHLLTVPVVRSRRVRGSAGCCRLQVFHELVARLLAGVASSEGMTGAGGPPSKLSLGCQETSVPP